MHAKVALMALKKEVVDSQAKEKVRCGNLREHLQRLERKGGKRWIPSEQPHEKHLQQVERRKK